MMKEDKDKESFNINTNTANHFDVIVIGSGMSGGWAAKEFTEGGLNTLVLERGRNLEHGDYPTTNTEPWQDKHGLQLPPSFKLENPILSRCGAVQKSNLDYFVKDDVHPYIEKKPFDWVKSYQVGGKSLLWARQVWRWSEMDFEANAKDGHGVDWPIRYADIDPWYTYVEKFIGVSGNRDGLDQIPDGDFLPPFEMTCMETSMKGKIEGTFPGRNMVIGRAANVTVRHNGRGPCMHRNRCNKGCPFGAYFSSNSSTLPAAKKTGLMTLRVYSVVHSIIYDDKKEKAIGVRVIDTNTKETTEYYSKVIFLNAGTLNTLAIMMNSKSERFPEGLGNDHDILGRYLMDHDYRGQVFGEHDGFKDMYYDGHRPTGCYIPRFRNLKADRQKDFLRGYAFGLGTHRSNGNFDDSKVAFGPEYKDSLFKLGPWGVGMGHMGEHLPYHDNRVTLSDSQVDNWGVPLLEIDCEYKENEDKMLADALNAGAEMLESAGFKNIRKITLTERNPGSGIHEMGGARMGKDPKTSILNKYNQIHNVKNVFVTDGACMTSSACQNPSISYMALTARAANYAMAELKKGNL